DDWALTRPAPTPARSLSAQRAAARALALKGSHAEAAATLVRLAAGAPQRASLLREAAQEWLLADHVDSAIEVLASVPPSPERSSLEREAFRRAGRLAELAEREERGKRWAEAGAAWELEGHDERALAAYQRAAGSESSRVRLLQKLGRAADAARVAEAWLRRAPLDPQPSLALAELQRAAGRRAQALTTLEAREHAEPRSVALHRALRTLYEAWGERARAERVLARLAELEPREPAHRLSLADAALARGDHEQARRELERAADLDGSAASEVRAAELLADRDLLADALVHVARARAQAPERHAYLELEASLFERAGRLSDAERDYRQLMVLGVNQREARRHLVGLWRRAGTLDAHVAQLRAQLANGFALEPARMLAALYESDPLRAAEQRVLLMELLAREPRDRDALRALAQLQRDAGELHAALTTTTELLAQAASRADVDQALALARSAPRDRLVPALLERARTLLPAVPHIHEQAAAIYVLRVEPEPARAAYRAALALDPGADEARLAWAHLERDLGERTTGMDLLRVLTSTARDESIVAQAARELAALDREAAYAALSVAVEHRAQRRILLELALPMPLAAARASLLAGEPDERLEVLVRLVQHPQPELVPLLVSIVARADRTSPERAAALRALSGIAAIRELYAGLERALRPHALWAMAEDPAASALLRRALGEEDPATRALAALALGVRGEPVSAASDECDPRVRAAVAWARGEPSDHRLLTLAVGTDTDRARALFSERADERALAARLLLSEPAPRRLPALPWPFSLDAYLERLAAEGAGTTRNEEPRAWEAIAEAATVEQLVPYGPGVAPRALIEQGASPSSASVVAFSVRLQPRLRLRADARALATLVHAGGADLETFARLRALDPTAMRALLVALSERRELPLGVKELLVEEQLHGDWPSRMWATRALRVVHPTESMALVRTAGEHVVAPSCVDPAAN
ncbi:MAG TPA: hypothetical protein VI299_20805, partial [Polyangiales bacterium]